MFYYYYDKIKIQLRKGNFSKRVKKKVRYVVLWKLNVTLTG